MTGILKSCYNNTINTEIISKVLFPSLHHETSELKIYLNSLAYIQGQCLLIREFYSNNCYRDINLILPKPVESKLYLTMASCVLSNGFIHSTDIRLTPSGLGADKVLLG